MLSINDTIMYGHSGAYKVVDICLKKFTDNECLYYVLQPVFDNKSTVYCPVDNVKIQIRKLLSNEEVRGLIKTMTEETTAWVEDDRLRKETQSQIIKSGDQGELIKLIKTLYFKREEKSTQGKKFHASDEKAMAEAEKLLYQEFAIVLNIKLDEVVPFITGQIELHGDTPVC